MPPIATSPTRIKTPVRIRFFNFDLEVRLISITSDNFGPLRRSSTVFRRKESQGLCHPPQDRRMNKGEVDLYETTEELCESGWLGRAVGSYSKWIGRKKVSLAGYASPIFANRSTIGWT